LTTILTHYGLITVGGLHVAVIGTSADSCGTITEHLTIVAVSVIVHLVRIDSDTIGAHVAFDGIHNSQVLTNDKEAGECHQ